MFWKFSNYATLSTIDTILEKPDVTLEELLQETDLIQELKHHNTKLIEFLRDEKNLQRMLEYVVAPPAEKSSERKEESEEPTSSRPSSIFGGKLVGKGGEEENKDENQRMKFALVCCEVLASDAWSISEALMENVGLLQAFWRFLERDPPLNPLQASYFTKVNENLLEKKTEDMIKFFKSIPEVVPKMLKHIDCPMVMDLLLKIISVEKVEGGTGIVDWLQSQKLIPRLLSFLTAEHNQTTQTSTGNFLKAVITISANASQNDNSCIGPNNLTRELVSENSITFLINEMLKGGNPLTVGVEIVIEVIRKNNSDYDDVSAGADNMPSGQDPIYLGTLLKLFASHIPDFMRLIMHKKTDKAKSLPAAFGKSIEPLGFDRFKTCELMAELLHCSNMALLNQRGSDKYIRERDKERERLRKEAEKVEAERTQKGMKMSFATSDDFSDSMLIGRGPLEVQNADDRPTEGSDDEFEELAMTTDIPGAPVTDTIIKDSGSEEALTTPSAMGFEEISDDLVDEPLDTQAVPEVAPLSIDKTTKDKAALVKEADVEKANISDSGSSKSEEGEKVLSSSLETLNLSSPKGDDAHGNENENNNPASATAPITSSDAFRDRLNAELPPLPEEGNTTGHPPPVPDAPSLGPDSGSPFEPERSDLNAMFQVLENEYSGIEHVMEKEEDGSPLIGDYLKMMFVEHQVVPTILEFFFRFPWNNFLHNVVYDVVQQVFSGPMDKGFNRNLAIDLFETGKITEKIIEGQKVSDISQKENNMRLGYMGHLTLIAEEVVRFTEKYPPNLFSQGIYEKVTSQEWIDYVENTLAETRERDNAILGGVRPELSIMSLQKPSSNLTSLGGLQGFAGGNSDAGLDTIDLTGGAGSALGTGFGSGLLTGSGFTSSSDEDDDEHEREEEEEDDRGLRSAMTDSEQVGYNFFSDGRWGVDATGLPVDGFEKDGWENDDNAIEANTVQHVEVFESYISQFKGSSTFPTTLSPSSSSSPEDGNDSKVEIENEDIDLFASSEIPAPLHVTRPNLSHIPLFPSPTLIEQQASPPAMSETAESSTRKAPEGDDDASGRAQQKESGPPVQPQSTGQWKRRERGGSISGGSWEGRQEYENEQKEKEKAKAAENGKKTGDAIKEGIKEEVEPVEADASWNPALKE